MARRISVELIGDAASLERAFTTSGAAATAFAETSVKASTTVTEARIAASAKQISSLRADQEAFAAASASYVKGSDEQIAASKLLIDTQRRLQVAMGETSVATGSSGKAAATAEKDLGKATRGALAGAGAVAGLGRSLAFASGGFLAFAGAATLIRGSITGAEALKKAQDGLSVAITKTGGNLGKLMPEYAATALAAQKFGISQADATIGLERATVLTGDAAKAQRAYQEALVISKALGKDFNDVLTATAKGQEGITTSLKRYGIEIAKGASGTAQFDAVMSRFAGQAKANTSAQDQFRATLANSEAIIGTALLPTVTKYLTELGSWLDKMNKSGRLQKDVNDILHVTGDVFHTLGRVIGVVDAVTGSFAHTLEILAAFKFAALITGWVGSLRTLATQWGLVKTAAVEATAAETTAGGAGVAGATGAAGAAALSARTRANLPTVFPAYAGGAGAGAAAGGEGASLLSNIGKFGAVIAGGFAAGDSGELGQSQSKVVNGWQFFSIDGGKHWIRANYVGFSAVITPQLRSFDRTGNLVPSAFRPPGFSTSVRGGAVSVDQGTGPFGTAKPIPVYKSFALTIPEQVAQAQASLTKSNADDVAAAKAVIARIKRLISQGRLAGASLIQALQAEGAALSTLWSAEDAAAQARAARAQAAKARIQAQLENSIDPLKLEVALSRAQALGKPLVPYLKALRAAAEKALATGKLSLTQQKEAYDQIASLNQQIASAATTAIKTFTAAPKLQLALAKDAALGLSNTKDLLKLKAAILRFIRTHKKNIQAEIDAYNQLAQVNQELGSTAQSALGLFKQASTKALTAGLGLTAAQRKALRERLSQLGPGGTVPGQGTGAYGYAIGSDGRPIVVHTHVNLDGKRVANNTTRHQHRHRRRNPSQRRGPNAATT